MSNPPTPRRCRRILEAHHLDCQGRSPDEIAAQLHCARSTVYAYFRDFQLHRAHILRTVAALDSDNLADQPGITQPAPEESAPEPDESALIQTNLDKSGQRIDEHPAQDSESAPTPQNSPPSGPLSPRERVGVRAFRYPQTSR